MPRQYIVNSWVGAAEYDEGDTYNGNQVGHRNQRSVEVRMSRSGDGWMADKTQQRKPKAKRSAFESICLADSHYNRLEKQMEALQIQFDNGELCWEDFQYAHKLQAERMKKAWQRVEKARGWEEQEQEDEYTLENNELLWDFSYETSVDFNTNRIGWFRLFCDSVNDLSADNILKPMLKKTCIVIQKALELSQAVRKYTNEV